MRGGLVLGTGESHVVSSPNHCGHITRHCDRAMRASGVSCGQDTAEIKRGGLWDWCLMGRGRVMTYDNPLAQSEKRVECRRRKITSIRKSGYARAGRGGLTRSLG